MEIIITNGGNSDSWYRKKVGKKFTVVDCKLGGGDKNGKTYNVFNPEDEVNEQSVVWKKDCELVLPQAPETTEILNEVKADKGILTEEELQERNRLLVLENDELSFDNMLRIKYEGFLKSVILSGEVLQEDHDFEWFKLKTKDWDWKVIPCKIQ